MGNKNKTKYKKLGGGNFRLSNGKIIKPNQVFWAYPKEISPAFKKLVIEMEDPKKEPEETNDENIITKKDFGYALKHEGAGWFSIIDANGKKITETKMRRKDAEEALSKLNSL